MGHPVENGKVQIFQVLSAAAAFTHLHCPLAKKSFFAVRPGVLTDFERDFEEWTEIHCIAERIFVSWPWCARRIFQKEKYWHSSLQCLQKVTRGDACKGLSVVG